MLLNSRALFGVEIFVALCSSVAGFFFLSLFSPGYFSFLYVGVVDLLEEVAEMFSDNDDMTLNSISIFFCCYFDICLT